MGAEILLDQGALNYNPGSIDALANAWPMLGMPTFIRNIGKPTLGEAKLLDTFSNVTMFNIVPILCQQCPNVAEKTDINQLVKFFFLMLS